MIGNCPNFILQTGDTHQLVANVAPGNADDSLVSWSSSNSEVASVDENGLVSALTQGTVNITVTSNDGGYTNTCGIGVMGTATGIEKHDINNNAIKIYPNPAKDKLYIEFLKEDVTREIIIFNANGQVIFKEYAYGLQKTIDIKELKAIGLVVVQIKSGRNSNVHKISLI